MNNDRSRHFQPSIDRLEDREVPAFLAPVTSAEGGINLRVGEFNHDGRSDVAVIRADYTVEVQLSNGDGTFTRSAVLKGARGDLYTLTLSDRNSDGILDIVASGTGRLDYVSRTGGWGLPGSTSYTGTVYTTTWLGNGDGTFGKATMRTQSTETLFDGWPPSWLTPAYANADFNDDGLADLAMLNGSSSTINVRLRNADGTYQPALTYAAGPSPGAIAVGDFNGDGRSDIFVVNNLSSSSATLSVLLNDAIW